MYLAALAELREELGKLKKRQTTVRTRARRSWGSNSSNVYSVATFTDALEMLLYSRL